MIEQYHSAAALEAYLGSPLHPANVLSFQHSVALDEHDAYPEHACALLNRWGFPAYYIPVAHGGKLRAFDELLMLLRVVARRDLTVAIAHGKTFLGAAPIWVAGSPQQQAHLAHLIATNHQVALALTEQAHGSDLSASEVQAVAVEEGYALSGEKWLINNATRGRALTLLARTDARGGPRGCSLFLVDKAVLDPAGYAHLPRLKTHGIRGADFSGIQFADCHLPASALVGPLGGGLEITLKSLQVTRTLCAGLSLGAADTGLRSTLAFALQRKLYGDTVFAIPQARRTLVEAFVDLLICECVALSTVRALHVAPDRMRLWSAVAKYFVPTTVEALLHDVAVVLGARHYLREGHQWGIFQKLVRDNAIVSLFDGSTVVNLQVITQQLRHLTAPRLTDEVSDGAVETRLEAIFALDRPPAAFDPGRLELHNRGRDTILEGLNISVAHLQQEGEAAGVDAPVIQTILKLAGALQEALRAQAHLREEGERRLGRHFSTAPELFDLARRHCTLHAAACCLHLWRYNRHHLAPDFAHGAWLVLALDRLLRRLAVACPGAPWALPPLYAEQVAQTLLRLDQHNLLFSLVPVPLASND